MPLTEIAKSFIYRAIAEAMGQGWSAYRTLRTLRELGVAIRTATFYSMWHEVREKTGLETLLKSLEPEEKIPWYRYPTTQIKIPSKYVHVIEYFNIDTGEKGRFAIYTNRTVSQIELGAKVHEVMEDFYHVKNYTWKLVSIARRKG